MLGRVSTLPHHPPGGEQPRRPKKGVWPRLKPIPPTTAPPPFACTNTPTHALAGLLLLFFTGLLLFFLGPKTFLNVQVRGGARGWVDGGVGGDAGDRRGRGGGGGVRGAIVLLLTSYFLMLISYCWRAFLIVVLLIKS